MNHQNKFQFKQIYGDRIQKILLTILFFIIYLKNHQKILPPPKQFNRFPALDLIEQIQTLNFQQNSQQEGQEDDGELKFALNLVTNQRNLYYSFSSQSDESQNDNLDS